MRWIFSRCLLAFSTLVVIGCTDAIAHDSPLGNAHVSPEALAEAALSALAEEDSEALAALMVTRHEYETLLWPSLPDGEHVSFDFVWGITEPRSRKGRAENISTFGGLPLELVRVDLGDEVEVYDGFTFYLDARMTVKNRDTGKEGMLPLMDALVTMGGGWKFLTFKEDL